MDSEIFKYIVIISISGVLTILLGIYAYVKRDVFTHSKIFILMEILSLFYIFGHVFELLSPSLIQISFWLKVQYIGLPFIAPLCLVLVMQYTSLEKYINRKIVSLIFFIPTVTFILSSTNEYHGLLYRSLYLRPNESTPLVDIIPGPWYIVHGSYTFGCMLLGTCILLWYWNKTKSTYWKQIITLTLGLFIPMVASFLYLIGLSPYGMDPVPIVMCFTSALYFWAIFSSKLFLLSPIARDRVFESMRDGVLVLDTSTRIVDYNQAAARMIRRLDSTSIGKELHSIWKSRLDPLQGEQEWEWFDEQHDKQYRSQLTPLYKDKSLLVGYTIVLNDVTEQKRLEEELKQLAYTDGLTKIYNRTYFLEKSHEQFQHARETGSSMSMILFDIDHFKKINDLYGHQIGDLAICHVVEIAKRHLPSNSILARYGGEEFVVCLPETMLSEAGKIAENIRKNIAETSLITSLGPISMTTSFGVSEVGAYSDTVDNLINTADQALYASKERGRNAVHLEWNGSFISLNDLFQKL